jgi:molecular chaperone DnaJ
MEKRTYYMVLGVSASETPRGIRRAYRELAKRLHPDVAGEESTRAFREATEAYDVLSDPQRRREYNDALGSGTKREGGAWSAPARGPVQRDPITILGNPDGISPSFEAMRARFFRNFTGRGVPKSEHPEALDFEIILTRPEAWRGAIAPIAVPVFVRCPECGGSGGVWGYPCVECLQHGWLEAERVVRIAIPPMTPSGSVFAVALLGLGIENFFLRLHVFVAD